MLVKPEIYIEWTPWCTKRCAHPSGGRQVFRTWILKALRAWGTSGNFEGDFGCPALVWDFDRKKNNKNLENMTTPPISKIDAKNESDWTRNASKAGTGKRWTCDSSYPILSHAILFYIPRKLQLVTLQTLPKPSQSPPQTTPKQPFKMEPKSSSVPSKMEPKSSSIPPKMEPNPAPYLPKWSQEPAQYLPMSTSLKKWRQKLAQEAPRGSRPPSKPSQNHPQTHPKSITKHKRKKQCFSKRVSLAFPRFWQRKPPNFRRSFITF